MNGLIIILNEYKKFFCYLSFFDFLKTNICAPKTGKIKDGIYFINNFCKQKQRILTV